ncbi:MAG TPA: OmpH family outer membrane protein [Blastocatellia bacterium]|nr:OmpH family outer membrane protein [Blastocatellia bacterium]
MKLIKTLQLIILVAGSAIVAAAQTTAPASKPAPATGRVALINSAMLQAKLNDYKMKIDDLNKQFEPRVKEVQTLIDKINALETTIRTQSSVLPPAKIAELTDQLNEMKIQQKRKAEDLQADGEKARNQQLAPFKEKLQKFLTQFAGKHNITLLVDLANGAESNTIVWSDPRADVSQMFITEYNAANPVPSAAAVPKP